MSKLKDYFRPEFLNRIDEIIIFEALTKKISNRLSIYSWPKVVERLKEKEIEISFTKTFVKVWPRRFYDPQFGADLSKIDQTKILDELALKLIENKIKNRVKVDYKNKKFLSSKKQGWAGS